MTGAEAVAVGPELVSALQRHGDMSSLDHVASGVTRQRILMVNLFFVASDTPGSTDWCLIDAGVGPCAASITGAAEQLFGPGARPRAILMTHGHFDHIGALEQLADAWEVPIYAHRLELPYLDGRSAYPPPDPSVGGGAMAWSSPLYPRGPINVARHVRALPDDGSLPTLPGWRWVHTPGHTPGHVSFFRDRDRTLIAGDAVVTTKQESLLSVATQHPVVWRPPAYYTTDWTAAGASVRRLADLAPDTLATGHGMPMRGVPMRAGLEELATHFDRFVPSRGRYVQMPATANEEGVLLVPPATGPSGATIAAGVIVLGAAAWWAAVSTRERRQPRDAQRR